MRLKQYELAVACLMQRIELNPLDIEAYNLMGMIQLQHNQGIFSPFVAVVFKDFSLSSSSSS